MSIIMDTLEPDRDNVREPYCCSGKVVTVNGEELLIGGEGTPEATIQRLLLRTKVRETHWKQAVSLA
jgi:hypothetical protein